MKLEIQPFSLFLDGNKLIGSQKPLSLLSGEWVMLDGRAASGKSTFLKALVGLGTPRIIGRILADDKELAKLSVLQRAKIGIRYMPPERWGFYSLSLFDNLKVLRGNVVHPLLRDFVAKHGNKSLAALSGGELTLANVAMATASGGRFLLLDDVFEGVDTANREILIHLLNALATDGVGGICVSKHNNGMALKNARFWGIEGEYLKEVV